MKNFLLFLFSLSILHGSLNVLKAQSATDAFAQREAYIHMHKHMAINEMKLYKIPASIKLAQGLLESGAGKSNLARMANNHFGIKCQKVWTGDSVIQDDDKPGECFRKYNSTEESYRDHSLFLTTRDRYSRLFLLDIKDYKSWAYGLKNSGYATNPVYAEKLIRLIEEHRLYQYDQEAQNGEPMVTDSIPQAHTETLHYQSETGVPEELPGILEKREVYVNNRAKYIISRPGDSPARIAQEFEVYSWQILEFNDLNHEKEFGPGQIVYIESKRRKGEQDYYIVQPGETMYSISQKLAIRLQRLYDLNRMEPATQPQPGQMLYLRKKKP